MKITKCKILPVIISLLLALSLAACGGGSGGGSSEGGAASADSETKAQAKPANSGEDITAYFTDPLFLAYVLDLVGKSKGDSIFESDVSDIEKVDLGSEDIENLAGIEWFTSMTFFDLGTTNFVTELDLGKNTKLKHIDCGGLVYSHLTELDVSNLPDLEYLDCARHSFTELDLSKNVKLTYLDCRANDLTELDLSNNVALTFLECGVNKLEKLDVSKNVLLEEIGCDRNHLPNIDITNNTALKNLYCGGNANWHWGDNGDDLKVFEGVEDIIGLDESRTEVNWD